VRSVGRANRGREVWARSLAALPARGVVAGVVDGRIRPRPMAPCERAPRVAVFPGAEKSAARLRAYRDRAIDAPNSEAAASPHGAVSERRVIAVTRSAHAVEAGDGTSNICLRDVGFLSYIGAAIPARKSILRVTSACRGRGPRRFFEGHRSARPIMRGRESLR